MTIDSMTYRRVMSSYPTGVAVITAICETEVVAMVVGSFTAISLSPPLVGFFPDKASNSWARLRGCSQFCVNILAASQQQLCQNLASKDHNKFAGVAYELSSEGVPLLHDVVARIICDTYAISDAGDHELMVGLVSAMDVISGDAPLLFHKGEYRRISTADISLARKSSQSIR